MIQFSTQTLKSDVMPPNAYTDVASRPLLFFMLAILAGVYELAVRLLMNNGVFVFIVVLCFFGSIAPLVDAKARQVETIFYRIYSAFYSFLVMVVLAAGMYYGLEWNQYGVMLSCTLLSAVMENVLAKLFSQVQATPDFTALLRLLLAFLRLILRIAQAVWAVINAGNGNPNTNKDDTSS